MRARLVVLATVLSMTLSAPVRARREVTLAYPYSRVWTSAVRLMRVDFEASITEKDKEDGYFLFDYPDRGKHYPGSMELVTLQRDDRESVRVVLTIQALPSYVETMIMERLARKLEQEFGPPAKEQKPQPPSESGPKDDTDGPAEPAKPKPGAPKSKTNGDKPVNGAHSD